MTKLVARIATVASLALAALPIAALPASAFAATTVRVSDINLASAQGRAVFERRVEYAARDYCFGIAGLRAQADCREGVRAELNEKAQRLVSIQASRTLAAR